MKKYLVLFLAVSTIMFTSCNKDNDTKDDVKVQEPKEDIQGKWKVIGIDTKTGKCINDCLDDCVKKSYLSFDKTIFKMVTYDNDNGKCIKEELIFEYVIEENNFKLTSKKDNKEFIIPYTLTENKLTFEIETDKNTYWKKI